MTLLDAALTVLGGLWAFLSAPGTVIAYGTILGLLALFMFVAAGPASSDINFYLDTPWYYVVFFWVLMVFVALLAVTLIVWGTSSGSVFEWVAR